MKDTVYAYLAGAIDSDGSIGIKRSTYHRRVRKDAHNDVFSERILFKQTSPLICEMLQQCFGGTFYLEKASTRQGKPLYAYAVTDANAARAAFILQDYLTVKQAQAQCLLDLRETKNPKYSKLAFWFESENPNWREMEMMTYTEAAAALGHKHPASISQAVRNGSLLALPREKVGIETPRIPRLLVEQTIGIKGKDGRAMLRPPQLIEWRRSIWLRCRELNKVGIDGTEIYWQDGAHKPIE